MIAAVALVGVGGLAQTSRYTVRRGDTLTAIAARSHISIQALAAANGIINVNQIVAGQTLSIPDPGAPSPTTVPTVLVRPGESIAAVSRRTGVPATVLIAANNIPKPYMLYSGALLLLAVRNPAPTVALARCPVKSAHFTNDWGFPRGDTVWHQGNDMMAPRGTPVVAPVSGVVADGVGSIGGNFFRLYGADGTMYYGAHLSRFAKTGKVRAGDVIGYVGNTGDADGGPTHLHFEIHPAGGPAIDPYTFLVNACR